MSRLIDADELKKAYEELTSKKFCGYRDFEKLIDNAPTVELFCSYLSDGEVRQPCVESSCKHERPQGEWLEMKRKIDNRHSVFIFKCPFCGYIEKCKANFCGKCGADLRGEDNGKL